ncbi:epidermal growth factor receptor kinase substrate 8-like protein 1 [Erpetoichthys calabaricus]|uniref:Epidermal growth factor receptor kinase substrate 8-like protein 1 n=1 Tax=Erpetoichthys calabaricus TaxID=27687 RepID=A0A8C4THN8_ERPCA|nr:epidermal growth factor receptor kinase substrate 8-like protein 1 [Erpetoichthys calabaricus]XP_051790102.1 epidermal growth factor receptor kinase substrate 8-like protein 1 [Erpetoichthys calabaricus]
MSYTSGGSANGSPVGSLTGHGRLSAKAIYEQRKKYSSTNFIMADTSQYSVNHLVTFSIDPNENVRTVEDALRNLSAMDAKGKIWTQEMLLKVESNKITLIDVESKDDLETFPLTTVQRCDAIEGEKRFPSLLLLVSQDMTQQKPDVHFFQCDNVGARLICGDINGAISDFKSGKNAMRPNALRFSQEKMVEQAKSPPKHASVPQVIQPTVIYSQVQKNPEKKKSTPSSMGPVGSPAEKVNGVVPAQKDLSIIRSERDVEILNHIFDDIELFMAKLKKSKEALQVLDQRKKSRKSKRKEAGEGLLTVRARPPNEEEFFSTFQKFKYAFSLLARVKTNIINPNSQELIHFLFQPLETIINHSGGPSMASSVVNPLLTNDAINLMQDTLNPKEMNLWKSLGDYWTKPRSEFPKNSSISAYLPKFTSGWEPLQLDPDGHPWEDSVELQHKHEELRLQQSMDQAAQPPITNGLQEIPEKQVFCTYDFVARNSNELSVLQGEHLQVLDDSKRWWKCQNRYGQIGYVPFNILEVVPPGQLKNRTNVERDDPVAGLKKTPPPTPPKKSHRPHSSSQGSWDSTDGLPLDQKDKDRQSQIAVMNDELLQQFSKRNTVHTKQLHIPKSLDTNVPLNYESNPSDVKNWLHAKGFSEITVNSLGILTGAQIFSLNKNELRTVCPEEGARVYSQIMVQKRLLEDQKLATELETVMNKQKKKVDEMTQSGIL